MLVETRPTGGKKGRKRSLLVDARGLPLSIAVSGANLHDSKLLDRTLAQVVVQRPEVTGWKNYQYLCLDAGDVGYPVSKIARKHQYYPRVKSRAEERLIKYRYPDSKPRRWVVEANPLLAQPLPQAAGQLRKDRGQLHGSATTRRCSYLLETNYCY